MFKQSTIQFLKTLEKNNNKIWFDEHRNIYLEAKKDYENFVSALIKKISLFDQDIKELQVKDCTFRINRDIRFSKDKTPYKINMGASLNRGGKKSIYAGYYFHLEHGNKSFAGGGLWMPMPPELKKVRQEIDYNFNEFTGVLNSKEFITHFNKIATTDDVKLINLPRGYEKTNPASDYLKLKSFIAIKKISDAELTMPSLIIKTSKAFEALKPFITFLNDALA
ncbi:MAG: DUF2461 domain-containing protein [Ginsengibacter sp.]